MANHAPTGGSPNRLFIVIALGFVGLLLLVLIAICGVFLFPPGSRMSQPPTLRVSVTTPTPVNIAQATTAPTNTGTPAFGSPVPVMLTPTPPPTLVTSGHLELTYPGDIVIEKADSINVEITIPIQLASTGVNPTYGLGVFSVEVPSQEGKRKKIDEDIRVFKFMHADLRAPNFDIINSGASAWQNVDVAPAVWTWDIVPTKVGAQRITVDIFGSADNEGQVRQLVKSYAREITVSDRPFLERLQSFVGANFATIIGMFGGGGAVTLLIQYLINTRKRRKKRK